jgi:hypothetical protein
MDIESTPGLEIGSCNCPLCSPNLSITPDEAAYLRRLLISLALSDAPHSHLCVVREAARAVADDIRGCLRRMEEAA